MAQGTLPGFISALRTGLRPVALRNGLRASRAHPSFPFSCLPVSIDSLIPKQVKYKTAKMRQRIPHCAKNRAARPGCPVWVRL